MVMVLKTRRTLWIAAAFWVALNASGQSSQLKNLTTGKLLVAPRNAPDPRFAETVILLVQYDGQGAVGLIVNHQTKIPISRALEPWKQAKGKSEPVYVGGPMELNKVLALLHSGRKPADARQVIGDVYVASSQKLVEKELEEGVGGDRFRLYLGYCGWGPGQLEHEVELGVWHIFTANASLVFDSDPASLWSRLIARTEGQVALNLRRAR